MGICTWANSAMVILEEWLSYRGGHLSRFDCPFALYVCKDM